MKSIGAFEAKTHLSRLLDEVAQGESFTITKHGRVAALLVPATHEPLRSGEELVDRFAKFRAAQKTVSRKERRDWITEGRR